MKPQPQQTTEVKTATPPLPSPIFQTLEPVEWNFDEIPDDELEICVQWEYARESAHIRDFREHCRKNVTPKGGICSSKVYESIRRDIAKFKTKPPRVAYLFQEGYASLMDRNTKRTIISPFPEPWQSLSADMRRALLDQATQPIVSKEVLPPFNWSPLWDARMLLEECVEKCSNPTTKDILDWVMKFEKPPLNDNNSSWRERPRSERPAKMYEGGFERLVVEIDWGRYTNEEITASFNAWLKKNRPANVEPPDDRGKNKLRDLRAALKYLGIMRALNVCTFASPRFPQPFRNAGEKSCYRDRKKANAKFRELFPFLNNKTKPIHWETRTARAKEGK